MGVMEYAEQSPDILPRLKEAEARSLGLDGTVLLFAAEEVLVGAEFAVACVGLCPYFEIDTASEASQSARPLPADIEE